MFRPRVIPVLLLKDNALVKSQKFTKHRYIGDPINTVRIFNDLRADELVFLDITASRERRCVSSEFVRQLGEETNMPFAVGGGIRSIGEIQRIIAEGAEKVVINTYAPENPGFIRTASDTFGSSTIAVCMDVKRKLLGGTRTWVYAGTRATEYSPRDFAQLMEEQGAGEIFVQSIARDGAMNGYDVELLTEISRAVTIPVVALGGAGSMEHLREAHAVGRASAMAAGSLFVYQGPKRGVLINYPDKEELRKWF